MRYAQHVRKFSQQDDETAAASSDRPAREEAAAASSRSLRQATEDAIKRQARLWGIRTDQARALLLDRKVVA